MGNFYVTQSERVHTDMHNAKVIIHTGWEFQWTTFGTIKEFEAFANLLGFSYSLVDTWDNAIVGKVKKYSISHMIDDPDNRSFWSLAELPNGAKKVTLFDNGHRVTCYFINDGQVIHIFRPNPNVSELHKVY